MLGFGKKGDDDDQRFWNLIMFNFYGTDEEFENASPIIIVIVIIIIILFFIFK